eukprot:CAMPEP_0194308970 /NCGR_PEP_ID=MMETSP0171-20130528/5929_1 /TAXON_ID=218684 /ORGANISM="Corethron pennatum, Strain L29A3" /LENGTH=193 /DNA_ID=CAMNT_0039061881 /DNA_START=27 /DNA_END=609 /DNA_ORIENTATION=-
MNQSSEEDDDMPALIPVQENQSSEEDDDMPALIPAQENTQSDISANGGMAVENNELYNLRRSQRRGGVYLASRTVRLRGRPRADGRVSPVTNTTVAEGMQMTAMAAAAFFGTQMSDVSTVGGGRRTSEGPCRRWTEEKKAPGGVSTRSGGGTRRCPNSRLVASVAHKRETCKISPSGPNMMSIICDNTKGDQV